MERDKHSRAINAVNCLFIYIHRSRDLERRNMFNVDAYNFTHTHHRPTILGPASKYS